MSYTLKTNAYHELGLDTTASESDVLKRSKEIINRLKADESLDFEMDIEIFQDNRTEESVKDALQRLQDPKKRIVEYFFWLQVADGVDEQAMRMIKADDITGAIGVWQTASEKQSAKALLYKKNLAVLYCLMLATEDNKEYLRNSLSDWKAIIASEKFWSTFSKIYKLHEEHTASEDVIAEFRSKAVAFLSDMYTELHHIHGNGDYTSEFQKTFSTKGERVEKQVLGPAYQTISAAVEELEKLEVSKDGVCDQKEWDTIKRHVATVQAELNKLIDLGLYEDTQTRLIRDRAAAALRSIALDIHNNLDEFDRAGRLHEIAVELAGTEGMKNNLSGELEQIRKNIKGEDEVLMAIEVPGVFRNSTAVFKGLYVEYENKRILYKDVKSYAFHSIATKSSAYGVPLGTSYKYHLSIFSADQGISVTFSARSDESEAKDSWAKMVGITKYLVEPLVVRRYVDEIFNRGLTVRIGQVEFDKQGYSIIKTHWFSADERLMVRWSDTIYIPKFWQGTVSLLQDKDGTSEIFATMDMSVPNAVTLPALVQACYEHQSK